MERHWTPINTTIVGDDGTRLMIVHRVEDVTAFVREGEILRGEAANLKHEILARARDLAPVNSALRESVEYRRRIVAIVGHDLRNPLSAISSGVSVLKGHFKKLGAVPPRTIDILHPAPSRCSTNPPPVACATSTGSSLAASAKRLARKRKLVERDLLRRVLDRDGLEPAG